MLFGSLLDHYPLLAVDSLHAVLSERLKEVLLLTGWNAHDERPFSRVMGPRKTWYDSFVIGGLLESIGTWSVTNRYFVSLSEVLHLS